VAPLEEGGFPVRRLACLITGLAPACEVCLDRQALDEYVCRSGNLIGTLVSLADVARAEERIREARRRLNHARGNRLGYMSPATHQRAVSSMANTLRRRERELLAVMAGLARERYTEFPRGGRAG